MKIKSSKENKGSATKINKDYTPGAAEIKKIDPNLSIRNISLKNISGSLDDISDGTTYKRVTANEKTGALRAYDALNSSNRYSKYIEQNELVNGANPSDGLIFDFSGIRMYDGNSQQLQISQPSSGEVIKVTSGSNDGIQVSAPNNAINISSGDLLVNTGMQINSPDFPYIEFRSDGFLGMTAIRAFGGVSTEGSDIVLVGGEIVDTYRVKFSDTNGSDRGYLYTNAAGELVWRDLINNNDTIIA